MVGRKRRSKHDFNSINRVMNHKSDYPNKKLVCITNGKEVLRISRDQATEYFFDKVSASKEELELKKVRGFEVNMGLGFYYRRNEEWFYTTKFIYKQYKESLEPDTKIPAPKFHQTIWNKKGEEQVIRTHVFI